MYRPVLSADQFLNQYRTVYQAAQPKADSITVIRGAADQSISDTQFEWLQANYGLTTQELAVKHTAELGFETYQKLLLG